MPIDEASIATASKPASTKRRSAACSSTGSGVVRPVDSMLPPRAGSGGWPMPSVPTTPQSRPSSDSACAVHQALEVLPLVPVTATSSSAPLGRSKKALAMWPVAAFMRGSVAMRASSKPKASTPSSSTRHVDAPASSAARTKRRPSVAWPGHAMKASPGCTWRLSLRSVPVTHSRSHRAAASGDLSRVSATIRSFPARPAARR